MLNTNQLDDYSNEGYLFVPELLPMAEISAVMTQLPELSTLQRPEVIFEKDSETVRSLMNVHTYSKAADKLIRHQSIIDPVKKILQSDVYVFQCILNLKRAFTGDIWQWHQDYSTYLIDDGMPANRLVNVLIFMDEVNEFNGPLMLVPSSHRGEAITKVLRLIIHPSFVFILDFPFFRGFREIGYSLFASQRSNISRIIDFLFNR